ncbi:hypothetical protein [uncultured Phocaeicola sp.]|uniref:hypothetical protein n=1 Tax=uncultured Phocaeicola sp. TaxID=990718 RepID=UPI0025A581BB|nr:hypothetical protein [uncultured Phocaeicola sp.]
MLLLTTGAAADYCYWWLPVLLLTTGATTDYCCWLLPLLLLCSYYLYCCYLYCSVSSATTTVPLPHPILFLWFSLKGSIRKPCE